MQTVQVPYVLIFMFMDRIQEDTIFAKPTEW
jgi:hypothetical protein